MASLPPRGPLDGKDPHKMSTTAHLTQATQRVNRFAKRDPALYPLAVVVMGILGVAGYMAMRKNIEPEAHKQLVSRGLVNPWDSPDKHGTGGNVAEFKYRHMTKEGHWEDSAPALNTETRTVTLPAGTSSQKHRQGA